MESVGKCPTIARGEGWALPELTDALHQERHVSYNRNLQVIDSFYFKSETEEIILYNQRNCRQISKEMASHMRKSSAVKLPLKVIRTNAEFSRQITLLRSPFLQLEDDEISRSLAGRLIGSDGASLASTKKTKLLRDAI